MSGRLGGEGGKCEVSSDATALGSETRGGRGVCGTLRRSIRRARRVSMMEEQSVLIAWNAAVEPYWVRTGADDAQYLREI